MSKVTPFQRYIRTGQPYTRVTTIVSPKVVPTPNGPEVFAVREFQVTGYTYEHKFVDEIWVKLWEEHDLGKQPSLEIAHETAAEWRTSLVGQYECE